MNVLRVFGACLAALLCTAQAPSQRIDYTLTPVLRGGALQAVQIDLRFAGQGDGETELRLPNEWGGQTELWRGVRRLTVISGATMHEGDGPDRRVLTHRPGARIHVRYRVIQDWQGAPRAGHGNPYRPIVQPSYFHLIGGAAFATPALHPATPVRLRPRGMPRRWSFASDLEHRGAALGHVAASVSVGGDYRIVDDREANVRVAIRGAWRFSDESFAHQVTDIIAAQRRFWGDGASPYLVTVTQIAQPQPGWLSIGGTGLDDAFAFFATPNADEGPIARVLAHEGLHTWIPGRTGGMPRENEAAHYWLSEGFTDFFAARILVREGVWTPRHFAADLNEMLAAYGASSVREALNTRIAAEFWSDPEVQQLPYQRGRLLAILWDARLRARGHDLDEALYEMRARAAAGDPLKATEMFPIVAEGMGVDVSADITRFVEVGAPITLPADVFAPCGEVQTVGAAQRFVLADDSPACRAVLGGR